VPGIVTECQNATFRRIVRLKNVGMPVVDR
jgi:hypothetical protein